MRFHHYNGKKTSQITKVGHQNNDMMLTCLNPGEFADFVAVDVNDDLVGAQPCHRVISPATGEISLLRL